MPYTLIKTNGNVLTVVNDASLDQTTNLTFVGKNYAGYGDLVNENFLKLLENFANTAAPTRPVTGQLWFDSSPTVNSLKVCYDGSNFKSVAVLHSGTSAPAINNVGELWWDSASEQLKTYDGRQYKVIGPQGSAVAGWVVSSALDTTTAVSSAMLVGTIENEVVSVMSKLTFNTQSTSDLYNNFKKIHKGITLSGADITTGSSKDSGYLFWGTAAEALTADVAVTTKAVSLAVSAANATVYPALVSSVTGSQQVFADTAFSFNQTTRVLAATASSALYADLAERYASDMPYEPGTVLVIGGAAEVTTTGVRANVSVVGIVSENPAYMMNSDAGSDQTHPYIALKGRVMCKVIGPVMRGNLLVTSEQPGYACRARADDNANAVIAKALNSTVESFGFIEVLVV